uniref:F-box/LRR-repeat protein 15/At3g58940/PEG3-like LRR domain-containing protein n=1 Tax=Aegilops tauschii TaxID=37682 RepID=R7W6P3_AEGTA
MEDFDISGNKSYHDEFTWWMLMLSRRSPRSENCIISMPRAFQGFKSLNYLSLNCFSATDRDIQSLISFCPALTDLILISFEGINQLNIQAPKVEYLNVYGDFVDINLDAPKMKRQVSAAYSFFQNALNLKKLAVWSYPLSTWDQCQPRILEHTLQMQMDHLVMASVGCFRGLDYIVDFVAKQLSWAPALEEVKIEWKGETDSNLVLAKLLALSRSLLHFDSFSKKNLLHFDKYAALPI